MPSERLINSCPKHRFVFMSSFKACWNVVSRKGSGKHCRRASRALRMKNGWVDPVTWIATSVLASGYQIGASSIEWHASKVVQLGFQPIDSPCCSRQWPPHKSVHRFDRYNTTEKEKTGWDITCFLRKGERTRPVSSRRIFCTMKIATVFDNSLPVSIIRIQRGIISVDSKNVITSGLSFYRMRQVRARVGSLQHKRPYLHQSTNDAQTSQSQVFKRTSFAGGIEEGIQVQWDMSYRIERISQSACPTSVLVHVPCRNKVRVSLWLATHWRRANALHTRLDAPPLSVGGVSNGYAETISWSKTDMTP